MRIVPQSASASYSHFSPLAQLLLPAPQIAGLLPSGLKPSPAPFVFDRPALADLKVAQRDQLYQAAEVLLEFAVEFMIGTFNENALRAAEVLFHRATGAQSPIKTVGPAAFNAEIDADWLELIMAAKQARPMSNTEAKSVVDRMRAQQAGVA